MSHVSNHLTTISMAMQIIVRWCDCCGSIAVLAPRLKAYWECFTVPIGMKSASACLVTRATYASPWRLAPVNHPQCSNIAPPPALALFPFASPFLPCPISFSHLAPCQSGFVAGQLCGTRIGDHRKAAVPADTWQSIPCYPQGNLS